MGCNESKNGAVATANTILRRKKSDKTTKDIETAKENPTAEVKGNAIDATDVVGRRENDVASPKKKSTEDHHDKEKVVVDDQGDHDDQQRLVSRESPNHFFSSRKDEEIIIGNNIDGIISEGRSGKSEYNTPRQKDGIDDDRVKSDDHDQNVNVVDDPVEAKKELADVDDQDQPKAAEENGMPGNLKENAVPNKESPITAAEAEVSSPVEEEKSPTPNAEEKPHLVDSPKEEIKTV